MSYYKDRKIYHSSTFCQRLCPTHVEEEINAEIALASVS